MLTGSSLSNGGTRSDADEPGMCLTLLGSFSLWLGPHEIPDTAFPRRKARSLLKLLALQPEHRLHRDQVIDSLWPDLGPRAAAAQLYKAIHQVRQAFTSVQSLCPSEVLLDFHNEVLTLTAPGGVHTDVTAFEALTEEAMHSHDLGLLRRAVTSNTGDLLPDDLYEEWTLERRQLLQERHTDVLLRLGEASFAAGQLGDAANAFHQVLARDPVRESAHRGLMRVYAAQGSHTRAVRQYHRCVEMLRRELDVEPSEETTHLYQEIIEHRLQPLPPSNPAYLVAGFGPLGALPPLVGRQDELKVVATLLERLGRAEGSMLALEGDAGVGKTRLAHEILQSGARRGFQVLWGSTHEQEGRSPYAPFIEALRMALHIDPSQADLIPADLAVGIPELPPTAARVPGADRRAAQNALFAGVLRFLAARARAAPVILALDDLHAADEGSLQLFHYLARHQSNIPMLLIGIWRRHEPGRSASLEPVISSLDRQNLVQRLTLIPLSETEHATLVTQVLGTGAIDPGLAGDLYRLSEGNPLFAQEMVGHLASTGKLVLGNNTWQLEGEPAGSSRVTSRPPVPASLQALLTERLARLSPAALRLLRLAAVLGQDVAWPILEASLATAEPRRIFPPTPEQESPLDLIDEVLAARLLVETGLSYRFPHPLYREAIYQQIPLARRQALHRQVARVLETIYQEDPATPVETIAYHYVQVGDVGQAVRYLIQAGDRAEAVYAHDDALQRYDEALSHLEGKTAQEFLDLQSEVSERIGDVYRAIGDVSRSLNAYQAALDALRTRGATLSSLAGGARNSALHRKIALAAILSTDMATAADHLAQAGQMLGDQPLEEARLLIAQALFDWHKNALEEAIRQALRALEVAEAVGAQVEISQACEMLALAYLPLGKWKEGLKYELRRQVVGWSPDIVVATDGHLCLWEYHVHGEEPYQQAQEFIEAVAEHATAVGDLRCVAVCYYAIGTMAQLRGELQPAVANLGRALELHQRVGSPAGMAFVLARQAHVWTTRGDLQAGWEKVQQGLAAAKGAVVWDHCLQRVYGAGISNRLAARDLASAGDLVLACRRLEEEGYFCTACSLQMYPGMAAYYVATGDLEAASAYAEKLKHLADLGHNRTAEAYALSVQGQIYARQGDIVLAEANLARAAEIFRDLNQRYDLAQILEVLGKLPDRGDPATQARRRAWLREAREIVDPLRSSVAWEGDL